MHEGVGKYLELSAAVYQHHCDTGERDCKEQLVGPATDLETFGVDARVSLVLGLAERIHQEQKPGA